jgi:outer membrane protein TolC
MMKIWYIIATTGLTILLNITTVKGQVSDTLTLLSLFEYVRSTHPVLKQADLLNQTAKQELRLAKGAFDPSLDLHYNRKNLWNYKENWTPATYFESWQHFFKIPNHIGDIKFGFERYNGINVNPENFTPPQGLAYLEIELPLARGFLTDPRRIAVQQAKIFIQQNEAERQKIINKLLFQITKDYFNWSEYYRKYIIQRQAYNLTNDRLRFVKDRVLAGDLAAIDSVEAVTELQKRSLSLKESEMNLRNALQILSVHLWDGEGRPVEIAENIIPENITIPNVRPNISLLDSLQSLAQQWHPELLKLQAKQRILELDKKLYKQELLPRLDFDIKPFFLPATDDKKIKLDPNYASTNYWVQNYKMGLNFYMPIFLRKERAKFEKAQIKILENKYETIYTQRELLTEIFTHYNEIITYFDLINIQQKNVQLSKQLLDAEIERFRNGESSLFLINSRERSYLSEQEKIIELQIKYRKSFAAAIHAAGRPIDSR